MGLFNLFRGNSQKHVDVMALNRDLEILNDCAELIENTVNPEVFFQRYDLYMEKLFVLSDAQKRRLIKVERDNLCQKYEEMNTESKKIETVNSFIDRMWSDTCQKAEKLKTENGKQNRYIKFYDILQMYEDRMPAPCIQHYKSFSRENSFTKNRRSIPPAKIDEMQRIEASTEYRLRVYNKYYPDYPEKPYISQDREKNTNWLEQAAMFPKQSLVKKSMMQRFPDGLLPGHVYMLYWMNNRARKRIPAYFEYKYGIDFEKERQFLLDNGYIDSDRKLTSKGNDAINSHSDIILNH